ncbi:MAG: tetratricopeptide repeat protein [Aggregatilineales bacterium]
MRLLSLFFVLCLLMPLAAAPALAQDTAPPPDPQPPISQDALRAEAAAERAESAAARVESDAARVLEDASRSVEIASSLLNLFEAFGAVVALVVLLAGAYGFSQITALGRARVRFEQEMQEARESLRVLERETQERFNALRAELAASTDGAALALSYLPLGERQYKFRDYAGALDFYHRANSLDADNPIIHFRLGYVYTQSGRLEEAEHYLKLALQREPDFAPALAALGYVYRRMGEKLDREDPQRYILLNQAEGLLLRALNAAPKLVDDDGESWWGSLGGLYRRRGQIDEAISAYRKAAEVVPQSSYALSNLALLYADRADRSQMVETYRKVESLAHGEVRADPDNYWAWADLLTARLALHKPEEAEAALTEVFTTAPAESPYALDSLTDTLERLLKALDGEAAAHVESCVARIRAFAAEQARMRQQAAARSKQKMPAAPPGS